MKVRLYKDTRKEFEASPDQYSLYFPYPMWLRRQENSRGGWIGCSQCSVDGSVIRCTWDEDCRNEPAFLGKRFPLYKMSKQFQEWAHRLEHLYNEALKHNDAAHWHAFAIA